LAIGEADGPAAAKLLDRVGYQRLPLEGHLPEKPDKPISRAEFQEFVKRRARVPTASLPADDFEVLEHDALAKHFPAVARWMLPQDLAVVIEPPQKALAGWIERRSCVVIRLRARKPNVIGGNLLAALARPTADRHVSAPGYPDTLPSRPQPDQAAR
jgi:hypothetical protein